MVRLTLIILIAFIARNDASCPAGYTQIPNWPDCYKIDTQLQTFDEALGKCQAENGNLVMIDSWEEHRVIQKHLHNVRASVPTCWGMFWIALNRQTNRSDCNDVFVWSRNGASHPLTVDAFAPGEPNCITGSLGCVHYYQDLHLQWNDIRCDYKMCGICEAPSTTTTTTSTTFQTTTEG